MIAVIESMDAAKAVSVDAIEAAFSLPQDTSRGSLFPGRMTTKVFADGATVVKLRTDFELPEVDPVRWVHGRIVREREIDCYPPDRTWFLDAQDDGTVVAGVATVRRRPLHLWDADELEAVWPRWCTDFSAAYTRAAAHNWRLDEGLSNFAWDPDGDGALRYLDDDLYPWDKGVGLASAWTVLAQQQPWLDAEHGEQLGTAFREALAHTPLLLNLRDLADDLTRSVNGRSNPFLVALAASLSAAVKRVPVAPTPSPAGGSTVIALLADIHANVAALDAVLGTREVREAGEILVLGDVVGYGPDPDACIARLRDLPTVRALRGNHDVAAIDPGGTIHFTKDARWAIEWTRDTITSESAEWLRTLPLEVADADWIAVHGAPVDPTRVNAYVYAATADDNLDALELGGYAVCFHGHSHIAGAWLRRLRRGRGTFHRPDSPYALDGSVASLVCPGSVGQPRDGGPRARFALYDTATRTVEFRTAAYDPAPVQARMRALGFPPALEQRLERGR